MTVWAFGDSHTWCPGTLSGCSSVHVEQVTLHRLGRPDEARSLLTDKMGEPGDHPILVMAGEIDIRAHVGKQLRTGRKIEDIIRGLTRAAQRVIESLDPAQAYMAYVIPPARTYEDNELPVIGSIEERIEWTRRLNASFSWAFAGKVVRPYTNFTDEEGALDPDYADASGFHLDERFAEQAFGPYVESLELAWTS